MTHKAAKQKDALPLRVGCARVDITPQLGTPLAGTSLLRRCKHVIDRLKVRAIVLAQADRKYAIVNAEVLGIQQDMVERIRRKVRRELGINEVLLNATHTHGAPDSFGEFAAYSDGDALRLRDRYRQIFEAKLFAVIKKAHGKLEEAFLEYGVGKATLGVNRRRLFQGRWGMMPNSAKKVDPAVHVLRFVGIRRKTKAIVFIHACHPTTYYADETFGDFPGTAQRLIEDELGTFALFLQGASGDIRPATINSSSRPRRFRPGTVEDAVRLGGILASEVASVCRSEMRHVTADIGMWISSVHASFVEPPSFETLERFHDQHREDKVKNHWAMEMRKRMNQKERQEQFTIPFCRLRLSRDLEILAAGHELCSDYAKRFQELAPNRKVITLGYTNAYAGYLPTEEILAEGGYEGESSIYHFGLPAKFAPGIERLMRDAAERILNLKTL